MVSFSTMTIHGPGMRAAGVIFALWVVWLVFLGSDLRVGWFFGIVSICYGTIMIVNGVRTSGLSEPAKTQEERSRYLGSMGAHLFLLFVLFLAWSQLSAVARSAWRSTEERQTTGRAEPITSADSLVFATIIALSIGTMIPFMIFVRELPAPDPPKLEGAATGETS